MSIYWVDANVLVRFLTGEPPEMAERAERLLERARRGVISLRVHSVVVAETVWVLQSFYSHPSSDIAGALVPLLTEHGLRVEGASVVVRALESMAENNVDFADALLAEAARSRGRASPPSTTTFGSSTLIGTNQISGDASRRRDNRRGHRRAAEPRLRSGGE